MAALSAPILRWRRGRHDGADPLHPFFARRGEAAGIRSARSSQYAVGYICLPQDAGLRAAMEKIVAEGSPTRARCCSAGAMCQSTTPAVACARDRSHRAVHRQVFIGRGVNVTDEDDFERKALPRAQVISRASTAA